MLTPALSSTYWTEERLIQARRETGGHFYVATRTTNEMRDSFLIFGSPVIGEEEIAEVVDSLRSGWVGTGPKVQRFESMLSDYVNVPHCRCVSSCTAALILSMQVLGIGPGDEVLVPAMTFVASANAVEHAGRDAGAGRLRPRHGLIDLDAAEAAITPRTRAIMPVHLAGRPVDMDRLSELRDRHGLLVIEDAAHAIGAEWHGRRIGAFGNVAAFSFYVTKNISTGEGGALVTDDRGDRGRGRAAGSARTQPGRVAALLGRGLSPLRGGPPGLQIQHDRHPGRDGTAPATAPGRVDRPAGRAVGALRRSCCRGCRCGPRRRPSRTPATPATSTRCWSARTRR